MRSRLTKKGLALLLALAMCLTLLPMAALADEYGEAEAFFFLPTATNPWGSGATTALPIASDGSVTFSLSASPVDSDAYHWDINNSKITFLSLYSNGAGDYLLYDEAMTEQFPYGGAWSEGGLVNVRIPNAQSGTYSLKLLTNDTSMVFLAEDAVVIGDGSGGGGTGPVVVTPGIDTPSLPSGHVGEAYTAYLIGTNVAAWSAEGLPAWLSLDTGSGMLFGTPTAPGEATFTVTATGPGADPATVSRSYTVAVTRRSASGAWWLQFTPENPSTGAVTDCAVQLSPTVTATPTAASSVTLTLPAGVLQGTSAVTNVTPEGVTGAVDASRGLVTLSFDGAAAVTAEDGISFTLTGIQNPDSGGFNVTVASPKWESADTTYTMRDASFFVALTAADGMTVKIENYAQISDMSLLLSVTAGGAAEVRTYVYGNTVTVWGVSIPQGTPYTVTLKAMDSLYNWHDYGTLTGTGDGRGNAVTLTPAPAEGDTLLPFRRIDTLGGKALPQGSIICTNLKHHDGRWVMQLSSVEKGGVYYPVYWLTGSDAEGITASTSAAFASDPVLKAYDREAPSVTVDADAGTITVDYRALRMNASVSGTVTDSADGKAIPGAAVVASQTVNGAAVAFNAVTDKDGVFTFPALYAGKPVTLSARAEGYAEGRVDTSAPAAGQSIALARTGRITVLIADGKSVSNPRFSVNYGSPYAFSSGSSFTLDLPARDSRADGASYTVSLRSDDTSGEASGTAVFSGGEAVVTLAPERCGVLDWSALDALGCWVHISGGYVYAVISGADGHYALPAGTYTVSFSTSNYSADGPQGSFTVAAGETTAVTGLTPPAAAKDVRGGADGPAGAMYGELYKVSALLETERYADSAFDGLLFDLRDNTALVGASVNGTYVTLLSGSGYTVSVYKTDHPEVDWTFPLDITLYLYQRAPVNGQQSVALRAMYALGQSVFGAVSTRSLPSLTLYAPARVGAEIVDEQVYGIKTALRPDPFAFSGRGEKNGTVRLYDNDTLIALVPTDKTGAYSGMAYLSGTGYDHVLRAEQSTADGVICAERSVSYDPTGPVLTSLILNTGTDRELPINGAPAAYTATGHTRYQYKARIRNDGALGEMRFSNPRATAPGDAETLTGKVFFRVSSAVREYLLPATKQGDYWCSEEQYFGANYPTGVEVLYTPAQSSAVPISLPGGAEVTVDDSYILYGAGGEKLKAGNQSALYALLGLAHGDAVDADWELDDYPQWSEDDPGEWTLLTADSRTAATDGFDVRLLAGGGSKSLSDVFQNLASMMNEGLGNDTADGTGWTTPVSTLSGTQASANGTAGLTMEVRTWVDQPTWTKDGVKWRVEELRGSGYKATSAAYEDKQYLYFTGTFYYDRYGKPSSLTRTVHAMGGVDVSEPNPDMFSKTTGEMIGSSLKVEYIYSVSEGKWMRSQTAMIPPNASSPIHLAANQIPTATTPPYRYTPADQLTADTGDAAPAVLMVGRGATDAQRAEAVYSLMAASASKRTGGMSWGVKLDKVQNDTYGGMALSATGYLGAKWIGASKNLHKVTVGDDRQIVQVGKMYFVQGSYSVSAEESIGTGISWMAGQVPQGKATKFGDIGGLREQLLANYAYYAKTEQNSSYAYRSSLGKKETRELLEALGDVEYAIEMAGVQDAFTNNVTSQLSGASGIIGLFGGPIGAEASFAIDLYSTFLKAANDTNNAEVKEAVERFLNRVDGYKASDRERKQYMKDSEQEKKDYNNKTGFPIYGVDDSVFDDPFDSSSSSRKSSVTAETTPVHDPSGIVYEGVIENPVPGAAVTLWRYDGADGMEVHDDSALLGQANPLVTDENGFYRWDVPEGAWFVTADKAGYVRGTSQGDAAATVPYTIGSETVNFLPVLPVQLDVNIPLTDPTAPTVTGVKVTTEGVYVTFSKYMNEADVLAGASYSVYAVDSDAVAFTVTSVEQGHAPKNVDARETTYTRTVLLTPVAPFAEGSDVAVLVSGAVRSYAGTPMGKACAASGTAQPPQQLAAPTLTPAGGSVARGSTVTITAAPGAAIHYTTDGSTPDERSPRYTGPIAVNADMTVRAVAVQPGFRTSAVASGAFTLTAPGVPDTPYVPDVPDVPVTPPSGGDTESGSGDVPEAPPFTDVEAGSWYYDAVLWAVQNGITSGTGAGYFSPFAPCTRAQMVTFLWRAAGSPEPADSGVSFDDVEPGSYCYKAVKWAAEKGITLGTGGGLFSPDDTVTRAQAVTFLWRSMPGEAGTENPFTDLEPGAYYFVPVLWAAKNGITQGTGGGTFNPDDACLRAQIVTFLYRAATLK